RLWRSLQNFALSEFQTTMFQPVGGMDRIGQAFAAQLPGVIRTGAKVTAIAQDSRRVTVTYEDQAAGGAVRQETADWCVCTL
ncbi:FAD-dependent oxidoreductase, partial [Lactococcus lactis]|uniref:FAD-dependent oxidoreductase n=1 Tax=Lactococcus lactis TaxID=1358 RepID=UPI003D0DAE42